MKKEIYFPNSFPNNKETSFLKLILCDDDDFVELFEKWENENIFDDIDGACFVLLPLLFNRICKFGLESEATGRIKGVYRLAWFKNHRMLDQVDKITELFRVNDIEVLSLKGISLIVSAYQDMGARFMGDSDILINPADAKKIIPLMRDAGWEFADKYSTDYDYFNLDSVLRLNKEMGFKNRHSIYMDIHWRLFNIAGRDDNEDIMPAKELMDSSSMIEFNDKKYKMMAPENMLLHVIVHGAEINGSKVLRWVSDAAAIIRTHDIDWDLFLANTKKYVFEVDVMVAFKYLLEHDLVKIPKEASEQLLSLDFSDKAFDIYYKRANTAISKYKLLGGLPFYWRLYWKYEVKGKFPMSFYYFFDYLAHACGLSGKNKLIGFILVMLKRRIIHVIDLFKKPHTQIKG